MKGCRSSSSVIQGQGREVLLRKFLESEETHTMLKLELLGLSLAAEMLKGEMQVQSVLTARP